MLSGFCLNFVRVMTLASLIVSSRVAFAPCSRAALISNCAIVLQWLLISESCQATSCSTCRRPLVNYWVPCMCLLLSNAKFRQREFGMNGFSGSFFSALVNFLRMRDRSSILFESLSKVSAHSSTTDLILSQISTDSIFLLQIV